MKLNSIIITSIAFLFLFLMLLPVSVNAMVTTTGQQPDTFQPKPTLTPNSLLVSTSSGGATTSIMDSRVIIENFTEHLVYLNIEMNWNLSPEQIHNYSADMRNGVLKKYNFNPQYPEALDIPNKRQFYFEIANSLGLDQEESAKIIQKEEENYRKNFENSYRPSLETASTKNLKNSNVTHVGRTDKTPHESPVGVEIGLIALGFGGLLLALKR
jgi:hypothetical protein